MKRNCLGITAFLIFIVFSLSGLSVGLFSIAMGIVVEEMVGSNLALHTRWLLSVPVLGWIVGFFLLGAVAAWFFEKSERLRGEIPCRSAGFIAIFGLVMVLLLLVGFASPLMERSGQMAQYRAKSPSAFTPHEDGSHLMVAGQ